MVRGLVRLQERRARGRVCRVRSDSRRARGREIGKGVKGWMGDSSLSTRQTRSGRIMSGRASMASGPVGSLGSSLCVSHEAGPAGGNSSCVATGLLAVPLSELVRHMHTRRNCVVTSIIGS